MAAKTPARKTAAKAPAKRSRKPAPPTQDQLVIAGEKVLALRAELAAAVAERNALMLTAKETGAFGVTEISRLTGFTSVGAAQAAINSATGGQR